MESLLRDPEEYDTESEIPTRIMIPETDTNIKETDQIGLDMICQEEFNNYINISIEFKQNLRKSYTFVWDFYN